MLSKHLVVICAAVLGVISMPLAAGPHGHAHGKADMELTVQGNSIRGVFKTPMDSLLGFEHVPKSEAQRQAVERLKGRLADPSRFFAPTAAAQCRPRAAEFSSTLFTGAVTGGHSDLEYRFGFECADASQLKGVEAILFADYPRLHEIRVQLVTEKAQRSVTLRKKNRLLPIQ
jgi:hypothetical protein